VRAPSACAPVLSCMRTRESEQQAHAWGRPPPAGGPGFEAPRPTEASAWLKSAVGHFRVLLMDQRGTGRSGAITGASLARLGSAAAQAAHLAHFRCARRPRCCCSCSFSLSAGSDLSPAEKSCAPAPLHARREWQLGAGCRTASPNIKCT
jgi:hypothetical protein